MARGDGAPVDDVPVNYEEVKTMVRGLLQHRNMLQDALHLGLDAGHFNQADELCLYFLVAAMKNLFTVHKALTEEMLLTELRSWRAAGHMSLPETQVEFLFGSGTTAGFISSAFHAPKLDDAAEAAEKKYIENILRRFLNARLIQRQIQDTFGSTGIGGTPTDLKTHLERFARTANAVEFIGRDVDNAAWMPEFGTPIKLPPPPVPTGMPWIDNYINGFRRGDIIGVLGPFSGGKTTLMSTAAVRMAQNFAFRGEDKLSIYICYEDGSEKMNHLFWSAAAHIDRKLFEDPDFWLHFSNREAPKDYDRALPENKNGTIIIGERERWDASRGWLNKNFVFLDFSENAKAGNYGGGGVPEIVSVLTRLSEARKMQIGFVAIDYAGLLLNRELGKDKSTKNMEQVWRPMQQLPDNIRTNIAVPFGCTVMLAHQLAGGDIKKIPPHRYVSHLDAQGSKAFAENLHACMCINTRDPSTNVSTIHWSKIRSTVPQSPYGLIKMDQHVVNIHLVNNEYEACETARRIVKKGEAGFVAPEDAVTFKKKPKKIDTFGSDILS
jgi:hypothetical protein